MNLFVARGGVTIGPVTLGEAVDAVLQARLGPTDLVSVDGKTWVVAAEFEQLAGYFGGESAGVTRTTDAKRNAPRLKGRMRTMAVVGSVAVGLLATGIWVATRGPSEELLISRAAAAAARATHATTRANAESEIAAARAGIDAAQAELDEAQAALERSRSDASAAIEWHNYERSLASTRAVANWERHAQQYEALGDRWPCPRPVYGEGDGLIQLNCNGIWRAATHGTGEPSGMLRTDALCCAWIFVRWGQEDVARYQAGSRRVAELVDAQALAAGHLEELQRASEQTEQQASEDVDFAHANLVETYTACVTLEREEGEEGGCGQTPIATPLVATAEPAAVATDAGTAPAPADGGSALPSPPQPPTDDSTSAAIDTASAIRDSGAFLYDFDTSHEGRYTWSTGEGGDQVLFVRSPEATSDGKLRLFARGPGDARRGSTIAGFDCGGGGCRLSVSLRTDHRAIVEFANNPHSSYGGDGVWLLLEWDAEAQAIRAIRRVTWGENDSGDPPVWANYAD